MGLTLFRNFFVEAENIRENLDEQTKKELQNRMMSSPEQVVIYPTSLKISKGRGSTIGIGILNIGGAIDTFTITSTWDGTSCYDRDGSLMSCGIDDVKTLPSLERDIESNKREIIEIPIRVESSAISGKYAVIIEVADSTGIITTNLVYINVP